MTKYELELQALKSWDSVNGSYQYDRDLGYTFIDTAGHGYLVVPKDDVYASIAKSIVDYGYEGELAYYLEEDSEAGEFLGKVGCKKVLQSNYKD